MNDANKEIWVFLSHSNKDYNKVRFVRNMLEEENFRPLMFFLNCLNDDDEIDDLIKREIDCRARFILCDSEKSRESSWVQREVEYIKSKDRNFDVLDLTVSDEDILKQIEQIKKKATIFISYNRDEYYLAEQVYNRLCKYDLDVRFDKYFLRSGRDFAFENMISIEEACRKGTVVALLNNRILDDSSFAKKELAKALEIDRSKSDKSILPFYLDKGLSKKLGDDSVLHDILKYNATDLTSYVSEQRADIIVNEVLKSHYRPGTILYYSTLFGDSKSEYYDMEESKKLDTLYSQLSQHRNPFLRMLFKSK